MEWIQVSMVSDQQVGPCSPTRPMPSYTTDPVCRQVTTHWSVKFLVQKSSMQRGSWPMWVVQWFYFHISQVH